MLIAQCQFTQNCLEIRVGIKIIIKHQERLHYRLANTNYFCVGLLLTVSYQAV